MEDNELVVLLDRKFAESEERMTARMDARFDQVDARFEQVDARFEQMDVKFDNLRIEVGTRLDGMHTDIKKIAEGVDNVDEKLERFRGETAANFKDVRSDIQMSFTVLGKRISKLEDNHS